MLREARTEGTKEQKKEQVICLTIMPKYTPILLTRTMRSTLSRNPPHTLL